MNETGRFMALCGNSHVYRYLVSYMLNSRNTFTFVCLNKGIATNLYNVFRNRRLKGYGLTPVTLLLCSGLTKFVFVFIIRFLTTHFC
jgi:hypothetical protein